MSDATGLAEAMLGLDGFRVLAVCESAAEVIIRIETTRQLVGCPCCGVQAVAHERMVVECRDLPVFGRPARLVWSKRRWRCEEALCDVKTWTETSREFSARCLLTNRAGVEACRQVGRNARPVAQLADELGVCWQTVMAAVREHGEPLVDDPDRVGIVRRDLRLYAVTHKTFDAYCREVWNMGARAAYYQIAKDPDALQIEAPAKTETPAQSVEMRNPLRTTSQSEVTAPEPAAPALPALPARIEQPVPNDLPVDVSDDVEGLFDQLTVLLRSVTREQYAIPELRGAVRAGPAEVARLARDLEALA